MKLVINKVLSFLKWIKHFFDIHVHVDVVSNDVRKEEEELESHEYNQD